MRMRKTSVIWSMALCSACSPGSGPSGNGADGTTEGNTTTGTTATTSSTTGDTTTSDVDTTPPPPYSPPEGMLRRLTRPQFANAIFDIFGYSVTTADLDADSYNGDFAVVGASSVATSALGVEQYNTAVQSAVLSKFSDATQAEQLIGCAPTAADDECALGYFANIGRRAWRRPLEQAEVDQLAEVARVAETELGTALEGVQWATVALFASPHFIYRPELGATGPDGTLKIIGYEMASRLSFLIWNSLPDNALLDDAEQGLLDTPTGVQAAAQRLLTSAKGRQAVGAFAEDYLRLDRILTQAKDPDLYPEYTPALQQGMVRDMRGVWELVAFDQDESAMSLFATNKVLANAELATLYGLDPTGLDSDTFKEFDLPENGPRLGILAKAGFLSQFANQKEGSPTLRGKFMREALMCQHIKPPPAGVVLDLKEPSSDMPMTKRDRLEQHRSDVTCAKCHAEMDPLGLPFESFDAIGKHRTLDHGLPIDPSGDFDGVAVADSIDLGSVIQSSDLVANCLVRKYYSYAVGHPEREVDEAVTDALTASFSGSGYRLKQLILDLVTHEAFSSVTAQTD